MTGSPKAIFLSYASQDADAAQRISDALRTAGLNVWFDQSDLRGGEVWDAAIRKQVKDCTLFMPLISAHAEARSEGYFRPTPFSRRVRLPAAKWTFVPSARPTT
jgi:uncharacterized protein YfaA (DUF2138 family)